MSADFTQKSFYAKKGEVARNWFVIDGEDKILGRLAQEIAMLLMGKHKPNYTPNQDTGDFVVVLNAGKIRVTGRKSQDKEYQRYTGRPGGQKVENFDSLNKRRPGEPLRLAVKRMLPKTTLGRHMLKKLKLIAGNEHNHEAQMATVYEPTGRAALKA